MASISRCGSEIKRRRKCKSTREVAESTPTEQAEQGEKGVGLRNEGNGSMCTLSFAQAVTL